MIKKTWSRCFSSWDIQISCLKSLPPLVLRAQLGLKYLPTFSIGSGRSNRYLKMETSMTALLYMQMTLGSKHLLKRAAKLFRVLLVALRPEANQWRQRQFRSALGCRD
jgi:hypothetical protein